MVLLLRGVSFAGLVPFREREDAHARDDDDDVIAAGASNRKIRTAVVDASSRPQKNADDDFSRHHRRLFQSHRRRRNRAAFESTTNTAACSREARRQISIHPNPNSNPVVFNREEDDDLCDDDTTTIDGKIARQAAVVKGLKDGGKTNQDEEVKAAVTVLKALKAEREKATTTHWQVGVARMLRRRRKSKNKERRTRSEKKEEHHPGGKRKGRGAVFVGVFSGRSAASAHRESGAVECGESRTVRDRFDRTNAAAKLQAAYPESALAKGCELENGTREKVCGRVTSRRVFGKLAFMTLTDASGTIQLYCDESRIDPEQFETIKTLVDVGDIVGCEGPLKRTDKGELSIVVEDIKVLTKSLRNLPDKWHGLQDVEIKYRQRYVDLIASSESRDTFYQRAQIIKTMRRYLEDELEFMEMETPIMHTVSGGADAKPFNTHHNAKYGFNITNCDRVTLEAVSRRRV